VPRQMNQRGNKSEGRTLTGFAAGQPSSQENKATMAQYMALRTRVVDPRSGGGRHGMLGDLPATPSGGRGVPCA
jgi:hypothetical protein